MAKSLCRFPLALIATFYPPVLCHECQTKGGPLPIAAERNQILPQQNNRILIMVSAALSTPVVNPSFVDPLNLAIYQGSNHGKTSLHRSQPLTLGYRVLKNTELARSPKGRAARDAPEYAPPKSSSRRYSPFNN